MLNKKGLFSAASAAVVGFLWLTSSSATLAAPPEARFNERARLAIDNHPHEMVNLIVTYRDHPGRADRDHLNRHGGSVRHQFGLIPGHAITIPAHAAEALVRNPNVRRVSRDEPVSGAAYMIADGGYEKLLADSLTPIQLSLPSSVMDGQPELASVPYTGAGVRVAVLDTGFKSHKDLAPAGTYSLVGGKSEDDNGHGNHVAAIVGGNGNKSAGDYAGVAPDAEVYAVKVLDEAGQGLTSDVIAGMDHIIKMNQEHWHIRVINMSLGHPVYEAAADDPLVQAVEALWDSGVVVV
ncbi:MAG: S8 family serine peptidase, partial [Sedimenticolaceae bacterium]